jgi:hypothetical protein
MIHQILYSEAGVSRPDVMKYDCSSGLPAVRVRGSGEASVGGEEMAVVQIGQQARLSGFPAEGPTGEMRPRIIPLRGSEIRLR